MSHTFFPRYLLRTPTFSLHRFLKLTSAHVIPDSEYFDIIQDPVFREALFLASPSLLDEVTAWKNASGNKDIGKLKASLLKYFTRMSSRCIPFGLFAGVNVGDFSGTSSKVTLTQIPKRRRKTRLDMFYLSKLARSLAEDDYVRESLKYSPNPSIYDVGEAYRYVQYRFLNDERVTEIVSIDKSEYLDKVFSHSQDGLSYSKIVELLVDDEITSDESREFVDELIDSQILYSEIEPYAAGPDFLDYVIAILQKLTTKPPQLPILLEIKELLSKLDETIGNDHKIYDQIASLALKLRVDFDVSLLFQVDLESSAKESFVSNEVANDLLRSFHFLESLTTFPSDTTLTRFKESFRKRYGSQSVSLGIALDTELGVGFSQYGQVKDFNPLLADINFSISDELKQFEVKLSQIQYLLEMALTEQPRVIDLEKLELNLIKSDSVPLSDSLLGAFEILDIDGKEYIKFSGAGGSSAIHLFARFCHVSDHISSLCKEIVDWEDKVRQDDKTVYAEIAHIPKARMGNVINRPNLRKYEIPYMSTSILKRSEQFRLDELRIRLNDKDEIELAAENFDKKIIPRLASAHNYRQRSSEPIYEFLGELQGQSVKNGVGIGFSSLSYERKFLPRVVFRNVLVSEAIWHLKAVDVNDLISNMTKPQVLIERVKAFRKIWAMPEFVVLIEGDNELLIRLTCFDSIAMWLRQIKNKQSFRVREFFFPKEIVKDENGEIYVHQFQVAILRRQK